MMPTYKQIWLFSFCAILMLPVFPQQGTCANKTPEDTIPTAGILSIGADGKTYIRFTRGHAVTKIGQYIKEGVAKPLSLEAADKNAIQRASYLAVAAAEECENAKKKASRDKSYAEQRDWICAKAQQMAAQETTVWATEFIKKNPDPAVIKWATEQKMEAEELEKIAVQMGAERVTLPEAYEAPEVTVLTTPLEPVGQTVQYTEKPASQFTP